MHTILITEPVHEEGIHLLAKANYTLLKGWEMDLEAVMARALEIEAVLVRTNAITAAMMQIMANLKIISKHGVGCDTIDVAYAREHNITVAIAADSNAPSVAEHTMMFILNCAKKPQQMDNIVRADYAKRASINAFDIGGRTVFVFGYGRIGRRVAALCQAFNMEVLVHDINFAPDQTEIDGYEIIHRLDDGLARANVLSVHTPLTNKTKNIINQDRLLKMPPGSYVINCARGGIVDERAVRELTKTGHLAGAGFDVYSAEPIKADNPLLGAENTWLSPHSAAFTAESLRRMSLQAAQNIIDMFGAGVPAENIYALEALSADPIT